MIVAILLSLSARAQQANAPDSSLWHPDLTVGYRQSGDSTLVMDIYLPQRDNNAKHRCIVFLYGGGFMQNNHRAASTRQFCRTLAENDSFVAVAVDYRLGLKGVKFKGVTGMIKPLENAIHMAVEDCCTAVAYLLEHAMELRIDPECIILCGSSAGAITALQTDYELCNRTQDAACLPEDFHFAGVASFAGAVFSREGKVSYKLHAPAPTLMMHGTVDKLVTYDKIAFFNTRFSGSSDLVGTFKKNHYPHMLIRYEDEGHGVAGRMMESYGQLMWFIDNMVVGRHNYEMDLTWFDHDHVRAGWDRSQPTDLYK